MVTDVERLDRKFRSVVSSVVRAFTQLTRVTLYNWRVKISYKRHTFFIMLIYTICQQFTRTYLTRSRRRVPPVARTRLSHRAACTTGGARLIVPSDGVSHRWLALGSHRAACRPMKRDVDLYAAAG